MLKIGKPLEKSCKRLKDEEKNQQLKLSSKYFFFLNFNLAT